jgi:2-C-methyl-D-erythritol 4-phosphate cytidylyltransferase
MPKFAVIMPAAGKSSRFNNKEKKPFAQIDGRAVRLRTAELFVTRDNVVQILLVLDPSDREMFDRRFQANIAFMNVKLIDGGAERFDSVANAIAMLKDEVEFVAIHDAVRPCATAELIDAVFNAAVNTGAAIPAIRVADTIKLVGTDKVIQATPPRADLWLAQTPQVFRKDWLIEAYANRGSVAGSITDDAQLVEAAGHPVHVVDGDSTNIKITSFKDLFLADAILRSRPKPKAKGPSHPFADEDMWR